MKNIGIGKDPSNGGKLISDNVVLTLKADFIWHCKILLLEGRFKMRENMFEIIRHHFVGSAEINDMLHRICSI